MSDESPPRALQRFARDLRRIRKQRDLSIAALHEATQMPEAHIQEFEEGTLYEQSRMNDVYLKAFIRAYAQTLGIPSDPVVEQLESALEGDYEDQLAAQFLDAPSSEAGDPESSEPRTSPPANRESEPDPVADSAESPAPSPSERVVGEKTPSGSKSEDPPDPPDNDEDSKTERVRVDSPSSSPQAPGSARSASGREGAASTSSSVDSGAQRLWNQYGGLLASMALVLLVLALGAGIVNVYFGGEGGGGASPEPTASADLAGPSAPPDTNATTDTVEADTAEAEAASSSDPRRRPADVRLGDTLHLSVEAMSVVAGVRVQQDDDLRRPYWIEPGEAQVFPFTRRITVENQLDSLRLFLEDYPYPTTQTNEEGRIIISRDTAEQFADTLRGAPASFPTPSDTVRIGPPPGRTADTLVQSP
jgi:transcriptional regulator with XRE-family HTH domain